MLKVKFVDFSSDAIKNKTLAILRKHFKEVVESENPDFLFYSVFGYEHLKYDCVRIFWTGENIQPDFNLCDYAIGFGHITFEDRYRRIPLYFFYEQDYEKAMKKHLISETEISAKHGFCNFVYSNQNASPERAQFFNLLSEYKQVDSGGRYMNNIGGPVADKYEFQKGYKFSIAFENSSMSGYTTEKILQAFSAGTIPIYWGDPNVGKTFNEKAFINCHNYKSFEEVVERVKQIDADDALLREYLSEPMVKEGQFPENPLSEYEEFIVTICSQTPDKAMRRSNILCGETYQNTMKKLYLEPQRSKKGMRSVLGALKNKITK